MATFRWKVLLLLVLCSCVSQRAKNQQEDASIPQAVKPAVPQPTTDTLSLSPSDTLSLKKEEEELALIQATDSILADTTIALTQSQTMAPKAETAAIPAHVRSRPCPPVQKAEVIFRENETLSDSLRHELQTEKLANAGFRERLRKTEAERDYWREKNRQKRWSLIFMGIFGALFIAFKLLAARVRVNEA